MIGPEPPPRRTDRKTCSSCEATAAGCRSHKWLSGRLCCERCEGNHDVGKTRGERLPTPEMAGPNESGDPATPTDVSTSRERHPAGAVAPAAGIEGRERGPDSSPAQTGLRNVDHLPDRKAHP